MRARVYNFAVWLSSFALLCAGWLLFSARPSSATTPIGSAKELLPYTQGRAACPFAVTYGGRVVGEVYCDGGVTGAFAGAAPTAAVTWYAPDGGAVTVATQNVEVTSKVTTGLADGGWPHTFLAKPFCQCTQVETSTYFNTGTQCESSTTAWDIAVGATPVKVDISCTGPI